MLVPLCDPRWLKGPLPITSVDVDVTPDEAASALDVEATARIVGKTGVEMEALTAVSVAALTLIDMIKSVDKGAVITDVRLEAKDGGKSGPWRRS